MAALSWSGWQRPQFSHQPSHPLVKGRHPLSKSGEVWVLATGDKYELLERNALREPSFATPAIADATLFFRTESNLIAISTHK